MNWIKQNPLLTGVIVLTVIILGVAGFFLSQQQAAFAEATEKLVTQGTEAKRLQDLKPYPDKKNLDAATAERDKYKSALEALQKELIASNVPRVPLPPNEFVSKLRDLVAANTAAAAQKRVGLSQEFYMGFDKYRQSLPRQEATAGLNVQLESIDKVVKLLLDRAVTEIKSIERSDLPEEADKGEPTPQGLVSKTRFTVTFRADHAKVRDILNTIGKTDKPFFVIRKIEAVNDVVETVPKAQPTPTPGAGDPSSLLNPLEPAAPTPPPSTTVVALVGNEKITVTAEIEIVTFAQDAAQPAAGGKKPQK